MQNDPTLRKPDWLKKKVTYSPATHRIKKSLRTKELHTVCESANCPNLTECFSRDTATFMILGDHCTRNCLFCNVEHAEPLPPDPSEPRKVAEMAAELGLKHIVITSVTRDDLPDGGSQHFADVISAIRKEMVPGTGLYLAPSPTIEVLTPDFNSDISSINKVISARPDIFNHNIETVERLTPTIRSKATYKGSLAVLKHVSTNAPHILVKSGLMVGLGETDAEVKETLHDLLNAGCSFVTIGQYLQPSRRHHPVKRYVEPHIYEEFKKYGEEIGIKKVFAGPFVRSSYMADKLMCHPREGGDPVIDGTGFPPSRE